MRQHTNYAIETSPMRLRTYKVTFMAIWLFTCSPIAQADQFHDRIQNAATHAASVKKIETQCAENEEILISCKIEGENKIASMCASKSVSDKSGYIYYAYGPPGNPEIVFPKEKSLPNGRFNRTHLLFTGARGGTAYSFVSNSWKYIFYSISGTGTKDQGIIVIPSNASLDRKAEAAPLCEQGSLIESKNYALRKYTNDWNPDATLSEHGLPALNKRDSLARCLRHNAEDACRN
ncbi:hypothetical protein [Xanthomonas fragariae]|uniref:hypothetical protein n=1 Tax=Xanthomonas fragariae TaxID=48664 RepID=UPI0022AB323E|nr:hypothetical protein [Xanthomonas fragariae]WAT15225.1 hypothetical protein OZ429_01370 [Xanthomonas fragariae]